MKSFFPVNLQWFSNLLVLLLLLFNVGTPMAEESGAAASKRVRAILFYQPFCSVCSSLIDDYLMPLTFQHVDELVLTPMPTTRPEAKRVFGKIVAQYGKAPVTADTPAILIGERLLVGEAEIRQSFSELLSSALQQGGTDLPKVPGLDALIAGDDGSDSGESSFLAVDRILAWTVMASLLLSLAYTASIVLEKQRQPVARIPRSVSAPVLALLGIAISAYLSYIELSGGVPVCGPVGNCAAVQTSPYAQILGVPMAVLGLGYYLTITFLWSRMGLRSDAMRSRGVGLLLLFSLIGVLFSIYLTALELFVIHAVCIWCLGSAVITAGLLLIASHRLLSREENFKPS